MKHALVVGVVAGLLAGGCASPPAVTSDLAAGKVGFQVTGFFDAPHWETQSARRCLSRPTVEQAFFVYPAYMSGETYSTATAAQNRRLHICLLTNTRLQVAVVTLPQQE